MALGPEWMFRLGMLCIPNYFGRIVYKQSGSPTLSGAVSNIEIVNDQLRVEATDIRLLKISGDSPVWSPHEDSRTFELTIDSLIKPPFESNGVICLQTKVGVAIDLIPNVT